jgi:hypothetical protein
MEEQTYAAFGEASEFRNLNTHRRMTGWTYVPWSPEDLVTNSLSSTIDNRHVISGKRHPSTRDRYGFSEKEDVHAHRVEGPKQKSKRKRTFQTGDASGRDLSQSKKTYPISSGPEMASAVAINLVTRQYNEEYHRKEIRVLKNRVNEFALFKSRETASLEREVKRLQAQNHRLNATLLNFTSDDHLRPGQSGLASKHGQTPKATSLLEELARKDRELEERNDTIKRLEADLDRTLELNKLLSNIYDDDPVMDLRHFATVKMQDIERRIACIADLLCQCLTNPQEYTKRYYALEIDTEFNPLVRESIGEKELIFMDPSPAFRAMIFRFIRDRIFYSQDIWSALHFEGLMSREYQKTLHRGGKLISIIGGGTLSNGALTELMNQLRRKFWNVSTGQLCNSCSRTVKNSPNVSSPRTLKNYTSES